MTQKITPCLWFDRQAEEAVTFYTSLFTNSGIGHVSRFNKANAAASGQPEGLALTVDFQLDGQAFMALNGGPMFTLNPSVSFLVACNSIAEVDTLWERLTPGGSVRMPLDSYPHSERYGWIDDRFGVSWQLMYVSEKSQGQKFTPTLMFVGDVCGKAEDAMRLYRDVFTGAEPDHVLRWQDGEAPHKPGTLKHAGFTLAGQAFACMDSGLDPGFAFNEAVSFMVDCQNQQEVDYFWERLTAGGEESQCGWLKDRFGVSWQIVPRQLPEMLSIGDEEQATRVTEALLQMGRIVIADLEAAYGRGT